MFKSYDSELKIIFISTSFVWHWTVPRALVLTFELVSSVCDEHTRQYTKQRTELCSTQGNIIRSLKLNFIFLSDNDFLWMVHLFHYNSLGINIYQVTWHNDSLLSLTKQRWSRFKQFALRTPKMGLMIAR